MQHLALKCQNNPNNPGYAPLSCKVDPRVERVNVQGMINLAMRLS